jgi:aspartyl-tRNA(Asn)/glutamyl-tRNA(Gln) amidotransferase subunit A
MNSLHFASILDIKKLLEKKQINLDEIYTETKKLFSAYDNKIFSCLEVFEKNKTNIVKLNDINVPLFGIPCLIKDNICQKGEVTSAASKILSNFISPYDATAVKKLNQSGAFSIGRANCDQFAMGCSGETSWYGSTKNPWDLTMIPGGSSSGSAAAVAAGLVPFSLGSETGGSIRHPASFCGIVGLKPTYGLVSRFGLLAYASSTDQIGILTRNVFDNALVLSQIAGHDINDGTSTNTINKYDYTKNLEDFSCKGKKIGVISNAINAKGLNPEIKKRLEEALNIFKSLGAIINYIEIPTMEYSAAIYFVISRAEAASNLSRYDGVKYGFRASEFLDLKSMYSNTRHDGFKDVVRRRIILGNYVLSAGYADQYYNKAKEVLNQMKHETFNVLLDNDIIFGPVTSEPGFKLNNIINNPLALDLQDYFTAIANLVGIPGLALPCGFVNGLPVGFQIMGNKFKEELLFQFGHSYQKATDWHTKKPNLTT